MTDGAKQRGSDGIGREPRRSAHRASYIYERGVWIGTCRACECRAQHEERRQAVMLFRRHIADMREPGDVVVDLTADDTVLVDPARANASPLFTQRS